MKSHQKYDSLADLPPVLTVADVQSVLRIGRNTAYRLFRGGQLRSFKVGGQLRCTRAALYEFLMEDNDFLQNRHS